MDKETLTSFLVSQTSMLPSKYSQIKVRSMIIWMLSQYFKTFSSKHCNINVTHHRQFTLVYLFGITRLQWRLEFRTFKYRIYSKTESIRKPNILRFCFQMVDHSKTDHSKTDHSKTEIIASQGRFIYKREIFLHIKGPRLERPFWMVFSFWMVRTIRKTELWL